MEPVGPGPSSLRQGCRRRWGPAPGICSGCMTNATDCSLNHRRSPFPAAHTLRRPAPRPPPRPSCGQGWSLAGAAEAGCVLTASSRCVPSSPLARTPLIWG